MSLVVTGSLCACRGGGEGTGDARRRVRSSQAPVGSAAAPAAPTGKTEIIKSIEFEGNRKFKAHVLRERLGFQLGDRLDPFLAEGGRVTIMEVYRKVGYPSVKVTLDRDRLADGHLLYLIEEGPRVQIASIEFVGNDSFSARTLRQVIKIKQRKWLLWPTYYTEEAIKEDTDRLRDFYYGQGYLDYKITSQTEFTGDGEKVHVIFIIEEGPVYHVVEHRLHRPDALHRRAVAGAHQGQGGRRLQEAQGRARRQRGGPTLPGAGLRGRRGAAERRRSRPRRTSISST